MNVCLSACSSIVLHVSCRLLVGTKADKPRFRVVSEEVAFLTARKWGNNALAVEAR